MGGAASPAGATGPLPVTLDDVRRAAVAIRGSVRTTPLLDAPPFPGLPSTGLYLKLENLQRTGAFKLRGATNRIAQLSPEQAKRGVIAASAGNHAQGVAWAARARGIPATVVMARSASPLKVRSSRELGAKVVLHGADFEEANEEALRRAQADGLTYIAPFDDAAVIAGQGTVGLEIVEALPDVRRIVVGVGGGGLAAGIAVAACSLRPEVEIVCVQPAGSDTLRASLAQKRVVLGGRPTTFADGLATRHVGDLPLQILLAYRARAVVVDDRTIARASFLLLEQAKVLAEGAGATPLAALLTDPSLADGGPTVLVVSGGNLDPFTIDRVLFAGLAAEGRLLRISATLPDAPGRLAEFLQVAAETNANVRHIVHDRDSATRGPRDVTVSLELEVRDAEHGAEVVAHFGERGWAVERTDGGNIPVREPVNRIPGID
ncbi:MAG: threonine ammonia-lyase [Thermoplasmata archaeon]|nr:threonine ammonia-lyase [Thermoplasmata archaeon]